MCFSKKNGDGLKIAENPIICYKYLYKTEQFKKYKNKKDEFVSPFHTFFWKIGKQYSSGFKNSQIVEFKNSVIYNKNLFSGNNSIRQSQAVPVQTNCRGTPRHTGR